MGKSRQRDIHFNCIIWTLYDKFQMTTAGFFVLYTKQGKSFSVYGKFNDRPETEIIAENYWH